MWPAISHPVDHQLRVPSAAKRKGRPALLRFALHYAEMVAAMVAGMVVLDPLESLLASALGHPHALHGTTVGALLMAANMTVAMAGWMRFRGHRPQLIAEMIAGMNVPFLALLVPFQVGVTGEHALLMPGHALMFLGMAVAMLARRHEYMRTCRNRVAAGEEAR
jgi:hypothetical protein